jgi:GR25 family glycosyltransferase involved in LPS biosynthesis
MLLNLFDEVYVINLPHRIDRRVEMEDQLMAHGIPFTIFPAIYDPENGIRGLVETMKVLCRHILDKDQKNVIILEDDAQFLVGNPVAFLKEILPQVPANYHLLYLGLNLLTRPTRMSENILKVADCYSTHAIAYSQDAVRLVLERLEQVSLKPYDIFMREEVLGHGRAFCTFPMLATQRDSFSDIEKKVPDWGRLMALTFSMHTKNLPIMAQEIAQCIHGHCIDGNIPYVNDLQFETQHPDLVGRTCDCGRFVYSEGKCPTCSGEKWKIIWKDKDA